MVYDLTLLWCYIYHEDATLKMSLRHHIHPNSHHHTISVSMNSCESACYAYITCTYSD